MQICDNYKLTFLYTVCAARIRIWGGRERRARGGEGRRGRGTGRLWWWGISPRWAGKFSDWPEGDSISDHVFCRLLFLPPLAGDSDHMFCRLLFSLRLADRSTDPTWHCHFFFLSPPAAVTAAAPLLPTRGPEPSNALSDLPLAAIFFLFILPFDRSSSGGHIIFLFRTTNL